MDLGLAYPPYPSLFFRLVKKLTYFIHVAKAWAKDTVRLRLPELLKLFLWERHTPNTRRNTQLIRS